MSQLRLIATFLLLGLAGSCYAGIDFVSVKTPYAVLYDAPKADAKKKYVVNRFMPLEQIFEIDGWVKVRDNKGELSWVEKAALDSQQRYVFVLEPVVSVYAAPDTQSAIVFEVQQQVALKLQQTTGTGWVKVQHVDGEVGFVRSTQIWGD